METYAIIDWMSCGLLLHEDGSARLFDSEDEAREFANEYVQVPYSLIPVPDEALPYLNLF